MINFIMIVIIIFDIIGIVIVIIIIVTSIILAFFHSISGVRVLAMWAGASRLQSPTRYLGLTLVFV